MCFFVFFDGFLYSVSSHLFPCSESYSDVGKEVARCFYEIEWLIGSQHTV